MTQEEKRLLLKDLCARLPYGVNVLTNESKTICRLLRGGEYEDGEKYFIATKIGCALKINEFKSFLRPMSSMTDEEKEYYNDIRRYLVRDDWEVVDWLNAHHFDYRGLIEKGLALEAPEGMYE